ncbi:MAG: agmatine deiminase family protein [bacterium]
MSRTTAMFLVTTLLLVGGSPEGSAERTHRDRQALDDEPQYVNGRLMLPAWETAWERRVQLRKDTATQWHNFRMSRPELYAVTTAPATPVHYFAEYDPADAIYYVWEPGMFDALFGGITHELITHTGVQIYILHHGATDRANIETYLTNQGDDPSDASFLDVATLGPYYEWQTEWPYDRSLESFWTVDFGPFWVQDASGLLSIVDPRYYSYRVNDDSVPTKLASQLGVNVYRPDLGFEGGNLFGDGAGTCFSTGMHVAENTPLTQAEIEARLLAYYGCEKMIWLWPLHGEATGHIDMFFKPASATTLLLGEYDPSMDQGNALLLEVNAQILANETNAAGGPFQVLRVPMPSNEDGIWRTYMNGIVVNDLVLVPTYASYATHEAAALAVFAQAFPGKTVVGLDSSDIIEWGGAIHCVTRTRPVGVPQAAEPPPTQVCGGAYDCTSGCGTFDYTGACLFGVPVYCDADEMVVEYCYADERCGWVLDGGYFFCVPEGCDGLGAAGECRTAAEGYEVAVTCSEEGFPLGEACAVGEPCGLDEGTGQVACGVVCEDECTMGEAGCDADGNAWYCGEAEDLDACLDVVVQTCREEETCADGHCLCEDQCAAGEEGCDADGNAWYCGEAQDGDDCLDRVVTTCGSGTTCRDADCVADPPPEDCSCAAGGRNDLGGPLVLLILLGLVIRRRRRIGGAR